MEKREVVCWEIGLVNFMIQIIFKKRNKTINAFEQNGSRVMQFQKPE